MKKLINEINKVEGKKNGSIIAETKPKLTKKSRLTGEPIPSKFNNLRKLTRMVVGLGYKYEDLLNNQLERSGQDRDFKADATYTEPYTVNGIVLVNKKNDKKYLRCYTALTSNIKETVYVNDNNELVDVTPKEYKEFFPKKSSSIKQESCGIEKQVKPLNYSLENIKYFQCGKALFNDLSNEIMSLLDLEEVE